MAFYAKKVNKYFQLDKQEEVGMIKAVFFDMNETLLDLKSLDLAFAKHFDDKYVSKYWFTKLLQTSQVMGSMKKYTNFANLAYVVLENVFYEAGKDLSQEDKSIILSSFRNMPAYSDVKESLDLLKKNEIKVIAVSNSSLDMMEEQLRNSGIVEFFDAYYSVDAVSCYKPFEDIYKYVARSEKVELDQVVMVACHDWDLFGAKSAGLKTAYIERKKVIYNPYYLKADIGDTNMVELSKKIVNMNKEVKI